MLISRRILALLALATAAGADVSLPAVFGEHMVLQRGRDVPVWGRAAPGERVEVEFAGQKREATADGQGRWCVHLEPLEAGGPHVLAVRGKNAIALRDVVVGEVWICSGQSNMAFTLSAARDAEKELAAADFPGIRLLTVPRRPVEEPQEDFGGRWAACSPKTARAFSAVGYFFGRDLHRELGVPVGLISTSFGGTPAEAWTSEEALRREPALKPLLKRWEQAVARERGDPEGKSRLSPHRPANLFNGMVAPLVPFAIRGAVWYQGESNAPRAVQYRTLFPAMIRDWRARWGQGDFPFYFVQLANFRAARAEPGESAWAELREAQWMTMKEVPKTGMAVIIDIGDAKDIHPKNKQDVGKRLAAWALSHDYGRDVPFSGPLFREMRRKGGRFHLFFDHADGGLVARGGGALKGFAVAGRDRKFHWVDAEIVGDQVVVKAGGIRHPVAVRYAWADNPECNLFNGAGFPASPFRTDDWPLSTEGKE